MAGNGLPIYYKNSKLVISQGSKKRWKEYYLLVCTVVGFVILIAGVLWFVPSVEEDKSYNRAYYSFTGPSVSDASQEPGVIDRPNPVSEESLLKLDVDKGPDLDPRKRKLEQDSPGEERHEPIPVPGRGRPNNIEGVDEKEEVKREENAVEIEGDDNNNSDVDQEGEKEGDDQEVEVEGEKREEEDPVTKERREKIVEV